MYLKTVLVAFVFVATAAAAAMSAPAARAGTLINSQLQEETGSTAALGGGDHVFVRFGQDAAFGIVYGTAATPNNIYVVAIKARYLGVAQVVDDQGRSVGQNRPIKIYTLYAAKLDSLVEFRDMNGNNIADYGRAYNATAERFTNYFNRGDVLYKKVDLHTSWIADPIARSNDTRFRTWTLNLTAQNLPYAAVANYTGTVSGSLPEVRFSFHLNASLEQIDNATVPQWGVTVSTAAGRHVVTNLSRMSDLNVSGKVVRYDLKWDQSIQGWTFSGGNTGTPRRILLEVGAIVGNVIPAAIVDAWFEHRVLARIDEAGAARFNTSAGAQRANDTTGAYSSVRRLQDPSVDFGGNWTRIARFVWVTTSVVDGSTRTVYGQVVSGFRFAALGEGGNVYVGFVLLTGLSFRGGTSIVHDPTITSDVQADLLLPPSGGPPSPILVAVVGAVALVAALLIIATLVRRRRQREGPPPPPPPDE